VKTRFFLVFLIVFLLGTFIFKLDIFAITTIERIFGEIKQGQIASRKITYIQADPNNTIDLEGFISIDSSCRNWLSIEPKHWTLSPGEMLFLTVKVDATNLNPGDYIGIAIDDNNTKEEQFKLLINVTVVEKDPILSVQPTSLDFGTQKKTHQPQKTFTIQNMGGGNLTGNLYIWGNWIDTNSSSFSLRKEEKKTITVTLNLSNESSGKKNGKIQITANDGQSIYINLMVTVEPDAKLSVSITQLSLGRIKKGDEKTSNFTITNIGETTLVGEIFPENRYLTTYPKFLRLSSSSKVVINTRVTNTNRLNPGDYEETLDISSNGGNESISVTFTIYEDSPNLSFKPT
jgi:hypothetical protein